MEDYAFSKNYKVYIEIKETYDVLSVKTQYKIVHTKHYV